jgi:hypothetical protein
LRPSQDPTPTYDVYPIRQGAEDQPVRINKARTSGLQPQYYFS